MSRLFYLEWRGYFLVNAVSAASRGLSEALAIPLGMMRVARNVIASNGIAFWHFGSITIPAFWRATLPSCISRQRKS
jgi:hypothetical protein